jgi:hypothetical protein
VLAVGKEGGEGGKIELGIASPFLAKRKLNLQSLKKLQKSTKKCESFNILKLLHLHSLKEKVRKK